MHCKVGYIRIALLVIVLLLIMISFLIVQFQQHERGSVRIGCLPQLSQLPGVSLFIADEIAKQLKKPEISDHLVYQFDWMIQVFDFDSARFESYLLSFGKRIGLDLLIVSEIDSVVGNQYRIHISFFKVKQGIKPVLTFHESLNGEYPVSFFENVIKQTAQLLGNDRYKSKGSLSLPSHQLWQNLGSAIYHQGRNEWVYSENLYRDVLTIDSTISSVYKKLAVVLMRQSLIKQSGGQIAHDKLYNAEAMLKRANHLDPADTDVYRLLGTLYIQHEWWNKAEEAFLKAFQGNQEDPFLYFFLSRLHQSRFRRFGFRTRESLLKKAIKINPALVWAYLSLSEEYYYKQKYHASEMIIRQFLLVCPNSVDGLFMLGKLYLLQNEWVKMIQCYEKILKVTPNFPDVLYNMGIMAYHERKMDQALTFFKRAMELENHSGAVFYRAKVFELKGEVDSAAVMYRERLKLRKGPRDDYANEAAENLRVYLQTKEATH